MIAHPGRGIGFHKRFMWRIIIPPTTDLCIYFWNLNGNIAIIAFHVDDSDIAKADHINEVKHKLKFQFNTQDLGKLHQFIGIKVTHDRHNHTITISQPSYIWDLIECAGLAEANMEKTPISAKKKFKPYDGPWPNYPYTTMIGSLMWAALCM